MVRQLNLGRNSAANAINDMVAKRTMTHDTPARELRHKEAFAEHTFMQSPIFCGSKAYDDAIACFGLGKQIGLCPR